MEKAEQIQWDYKNVKHTYVLMPNHFHLVVETPQASLAAGMKWFLGAYTPWFNRRHKIRAP